MTKQYKADLVEAVEELEKMAAEKQRLELSIARQKKRVAALIELANDEEDAEAPTGLVEGITDACRTVLMAAEKPLSPAEVRDRVESLGLRSQKNLLASVYAVLRRLPKSDAHVEEITTVGATPLYRYVQTLPSFLKNTILVNTLMAEREAARNKKH